MSFLRVFGVGAQKMLDFSAPENSKVTQLFSPTPVTPKGMVTKANK